MRLANILPWTMHRWAAKFRRELCPVPMTYYLAQGLKLIGPGEWRSVFCPFHSDHRPSLRLRVATGGFPCMVCDEREVVREVPVEVTDRDAGRTPRPGPERPRKPRAVSGQRDIGPGPHTHHADRNDHPGIPSVRPVAGAEGLTADGANWW